MPTEKPTSPTTPPAGEYEPPRVEMSLSPETLEREVLYAGRGSDDV